MVQNLHAVALVVPDYDEALAFYVGDLGFQLIADHPMGTDPTGAAKRWVLIAPPGATEGHILLARASTPEQVASIGNQTGGRVFLFLKTDDFDRDYAAMVAKGVTFLEHPRTEDYGKVVVWQDPFGNKWDLLELT